MTTPTKRSVTPKLWLIPLGLAIVGLISVPLFLRFTGSAEPVVKARAALAERDFERAQTLLINHVVHWKYDVEAHVLLAESFRRAPVEDLAQATEHLIVAGRTGGSTPQLELEADLLEFQEMGGPAPTKARLEARLETHRDDRPLVYEALVRGNIRVGRLNTANRWLDEWIRQSPNDWWPRLWRGCLFQYMGRPQLAIEDFRLVVDKRPESWRGLKHLGQVLATSGYDYQEAESLLRQYLTTQPDDVDALTALAICEQAIGKLDDAEATLARVLESEPDHAESLLRLATIQLDRGDDAEAIESLEKLQRASNAFNPEIALQRLLALDPLLETPHQTQRSEEILHLEAKALRRIGRTEEAEARVKQLEQLQRDVARLKKLLEQRKERADEPDYLYEVCELYLAIGQNFEAIRWLDQLQNLDPMDARLAPMYQRLEADNPSAGNGGGP